MLAPPRQSRRLQVALSDIFDGDDVARGIYSHLNLSHLVRLEAATGKKASGAEIDSSFPVVLTVPIVKWLRKRRILAKRVIIPRNAGLIVLQYLNFAWRSIAAIEFDCCYRLTPYVYHIITMLSRRPKVVELSIVGMCAALFRDLIEGQPNLRLVSIALNPYDPFSDLEWLPPAIQLSSGNITTLDLSAALAGVINDKLLVELCPVCPLLENVRLDGATHVNDRGLRSLGENCAHLRSVVIHQCSGVTDEGIASFCHGGPKADLHTLTITGVELGAQSVTAIAAGMPSLRILQLGFAASIAPEAFKTLFEACLHLQHLALNWAVAVMMARAWMFLIAEALKSVTITEYTSQVRAEDVKLLAEQLPGVQNLQLHLREKTGDAAVKALVGRVSMLPEITTGVPSYRGALTKLQTVYLRDCKNVRDAVVVALIRSNPSIHAITLTDARRITDAVLHALCALGAGLRCVELPGSPLLTDDGVRALAVACRHLECANLSRSALLTDTAVAALATHCPGLTNVLLAHCPHLTHASLALLSHRCRRLRHLVVPHGALTDEQVAAMEADHPALPLAVERVGP